MKKFLFVCAILFIANLGCKKNNLGGGGLCACSPERGPELNLVVKSSTGTDLLDEKITGAYSKDKIKVFQKTADGKETPVVFAVRPPFSYGDEKFNFNTIYVSLNFLRTSTNDKFYLKLGDDKIYELSLSLNESKYDLSKLLIDNKEIEKDKSNIANYVTVFYLTAL
ncbi:hypothetical protein [Pedobacter sp. V48]|uniref:hypothetical protein n=1 Tax=Pedobacter sp. V48 TaxID=509635 RepID=UPI0003E4D2F7|nr:hypothetical protein [Pedobacter sp. V48]ETZ21826.1 hypothetical protein N824_26680 [Pedobacter sp. V48]